MYMSTKHTNTVALHTTALEQPNAFLQARVFTNLFSRYKTKHKTKEIVELEAEF